MFHFSSDIFKQNYSILYPFQVTTKNDDANEAFVKEAEKLSQKKEYKGGILLVETSAHENINVDLAFIALAQQIDRSKGRSKIVPFVEAARARKEMLDASTEAFMSLIRSQVWTYSRVRWYSMLYFSLR